MQFIYQIMGKESSERIQTSILNGLEKKVLIKLATIQPRWVTSDMLTYLGVVGAIICAIGFTLAHINIHYLWLSSLGLVINWYGDSLDGTIARVRQTQRPVYGFFIDHSLDAVTIIIMCIGAGFSPIFRLDIALLVLAGYLALSIYTYVCTILEGKFRLTYGALGPTEFRLAIILLNTICMYTPWIHIQFQCFNQHFGVYDLGAICIGIFIYTAYIVQFIKDRRILAEQDPIKPYHPENQ